MVKREVNLTEIELDAGLQMRQSDPPVEEYEEILRKDRGEWPFPPLVCVQVEERLLLVSGFTRYRAALAAGRKKAPCEIAKGTWKSAVEMALGENAEHGFRRTNADKRRAVLRAVEEGITGPTILSRLCKISRTTVYSFLAELEAHREGKVKEKGKGSTKPSSKAKSTGVAEVGGSKQAESEITDVCPVCQSQDWVASDAGYECSVCKHIHGESAGSEEGEADKAWVTDREEVVKSGVSKDLATLSADYGRLVRSLKRCGLDVEAKTAMERINRLVQGALAKNRK